MTQYFPIIVEQESNGTFSAWVAGLPGVYAAADTVTAAKRGIRRALPAHLTALGTLCREPQLTADVTVLRRDVYATRRDSFRFVGVGALLGRGTSRAKAASSRSNGRKAADPPRLQAEPSTPGNRPTSPAVAEGSLSWGYQIFVALCCKHVDGQHAWWSAPVDAQQKEPSTHR
jgi:predicted RNase H-like HicB family nuclease